MKMQPSPSFSLDQMEAFVAVADHGSFSAAARARGQAQPGLSVAIRTLEARLGYALFDRSAYRPQLTAEGLALLPHARRLTAEAHAANVAARTIGERDGTLAISVDVACPMSLLLPALTALQAEIPGFGVAWFGDALDGVPKRVMGETAELGIASSFADIPPELNRIAVASIGFRIVAAATHPLACDPSPGTEALADHVQIIMMDASGAPASREFGIMGRQLWKTSSYSALREMLLAGLGYAVVPQHFCPRDVDDGRLAVLAASPPFLRQSGIAPFYLIWRADGILSHAAQRFVALLSREDQIIPASGLEGSA